MPLVNAYQASAVVGNGTVAQLTLETVDNEWWGIEGGRSVTMTSFYLSRVYEWEAALPAAVVQLSREVSRECSNGHGRTLLSGNLEPSARKRGMRKRQWVDGAPAYGGAAAAERGGKRLRGSGGSGSKRQQ